MARDRPGRDAGAWTFELPAARFVWLTVAWIDALKRPDTRTIAADWLKTNTPKGTRVAVENSGPTYLESAGFKIAGVQVLVDRPLEFYRSRVDYLVISTADTTRYGEFLSAGPTVFQVSPTAQRWGPPIQIVRLIPAVASN